MRLNEGPGSVKGDGPAGSVFVRRYPDTLPKKYPTRAVHGSLWAFYRVLIALTGHVYDDLIEKISGQTASLCYGDTTVVGQDCQIK